MAHLVAMVCHRGTGGGLGDCGVLAGAQRFGLGDREPLNLRDSFKCCAFLVGQGQANARERIGVGYGH